MSVYNLNDNVSDSFEFEVGGHKYKMRYPTLPEAQKIGIESEKAGDDIDTFLKVVYSFVDSVEDAPPIAETMKKQNMLVFKRFATMIRTEFGISEDI